MENEINFYVLNRDNKTVATLSTEELGEHTPVISAQVSSKINSYDNLTLTIPADSTEAALIKEDYTIVFEDITGWREYVITVVEDIDGDKMERTITAELSSVELLDEVVEIASINSNDPETILNTVLTGTRWNTGTVDAAIYNSAFNEEIQFKTVLEVIELISQKYNCEVAFSYTLDGNKIARRFVNLYKQVGADKGKRFEVDKDVTEIVRTVDTTGIKTAIIPFGKEPDEAEPGKAQPKRLDIKDVIWSKAQGDPVDKPKGQTWLGDPAALNAWGKLDSTGVKRHRFIAMEIETETAAELATMAWVNLGKYTSPSVTYEGKVIDLYAITGDEDLAHEQVALGDRVAVLDHYFAEPLAVQSRVVELVRDLLDPLNNEVVLGDSKQTLQVGNVEKAVEQLSTQVAKANYNASYAIINGSGSITYYGSVEPVNPAEGDSWFRPHPDKPGENQLLIFNGTVWEIAADTAELGAVKEEVDAAVLDIDVAKEAANAAVAKAEQAVSDVDTRIAEIEAEIETSFKGKLDVTAYDAAKKLQDAEIAKKVAESTYSAMVSSLNTAISGHNTRITKTETELTSKADKTVVDAVSGRLSTAETSISQTAAALTSKASTADLNAATGRLSTAESKITQQANEIASKVSSTDFDAVTGRVATAESKITQNATAINARLTQAQVDSLITGKKYVNETTLNATANGLSASITQVSTDLSNLEIGGRNLILGSSNPVIIAPKNTGSAGDQYNYAQFKANMKKGEIYTFSFDIEITNGVFDRVSIYPQYGYSDLLVVPIINGKVSITFTATADTNSNITYVYAGLAGGTRGNGATITNYQIKQGNKATDWTPAPEDMATLEKVTSIEANVNGLQTTVASKADKTQITQLSNQISAKVESATYNSKMTQLDNAINLRVVSGDVTAAILADKKIKDTRATNQLPSWYFANYPSQTVEEFKQRTTMGVAGSATYGKLVTDVPWTGTSGGVVVQTFKSSDGTFQRQGNAAATAWTAWDKIAEAGTLMSQLNINPEGILLQGKNIQLDGDVTMTNAFASKIKAIDLIADRITSGTLNAANVNIINLNANNIVSGTVSGINSNWSLNTGQMEFTNPSTGDQLRFTQGQIDFRNGAQMRHLKYNAEGLMLIPGTGNTGTSLNTSLHLKGGRTGSHQYIQFISGDNISQRIETIDNEMFIYHAAGGELHIREYYNTGKDSGKISASTFTTSANNSGDFLIITGDQIKTPNWNGTDNFRNIYITPHGTGSVIIGDTTGYRRSIGASNFITQSTRESKLNIERYRGCGLDVINALKVSTFNMKQDLYNGINERKIGFIAEESDPIAFKDNGKYMGVDTYTTSAFLVKAIQELHVDHELLKEKIKQLESVKNE